MLVKFLFEGLTAMMGIVPYVHVYTCNVFCVIVADDDIECVYWI